MPPVTTSYCTIATAGHVDHGKTALIKALTGINPDRLKEEQEREMTTDLGFAHLDFTLNEGNSKFVLGFIDVPGHGKFLKNMLAGVGGIDSALLAVAADEGPMPQTVQHVKILSLLGVKSCVGAVTKVDLVSEQQISKVASDVKGLLAQFNIDLLSLNPISTVTGDGVDALKENLRKHFYKGDQPFSEELVSTVDPAADENNLFMAVDRVFTKAGYGLVATGTLVSGALHTGDQINIEPGSVKARVRGMESFGKAVDTAEAGQRVAVNLAVKDGGVVARGHCIVGEGRAVVHNLIVEIVDHGGSLSPQPVKLYHGTAEAKGTLRWMEKAGCKHYGQLFLDDPIVAEPGERYVIRYGDEGIAGGAIVMCDRPRWLTRQLLHDVSSALIENTDAGNEKAFALTVAAHPLKAVSLKQLEWFMPVEKLTSAAAGAVASGSVFIIADLYMAVSTRDQIGEKIRALLSTLMKNEDNARFGVSIETMRKKTFNTLTRPVMQAIVADLAEKRLCSREGDRMFTVDDAFGSVASAGSSAGSGINTGSNSANGEGEGEPLSAANVSRAVFPDDADFSKTNRLRDKVIALLNQHPCLEIADVAQQCKIDIKQLNLLLDAMVKNKQVAIVDHDFVATTGKLRAAHLLLSRLWAAKQEITPSDFREGMSTTRKYAMALLGHFDEKAITRRISGKRVLLKEPG